MKNKVGILLTACVNPNGMSKTILQDSKIRKKQYLAALDFYLIKTNLPIVLVENTNYILDKKYDTYIQKGRLEYISFQGNEYEKSKGKGYGEALIILHAIEKSRIIKNTKYIIKITGRVIISNINRIAASPLYLLNNLFRCDLLSEDFARTVIFITRPNTIKEILNKRKEEISENKDGILFEHIIHQELVKDTSIQFIPFTFTTNIEGIFATKNTPYENKPSIITFRDNFYFWGQILKRQKSFTKSKTVHYLYKFSLLLYRNI